MFFVTVLVFSQSCKNTEIPQTVINSDKIFDSDKNRCIDEEISSDTMEKSYNQSFGLHEEGITLACMCFGMKLRLHQNPE